MQAAGPHLAAVDAVLLEGALLRDAAGGASEQCAAEAQHPKREGEAAAVAAAVADDNNDGAALALAALAALGTECVDSSRRPNWSVGGAAFPPKAMPSIAVAEG